MSWNSESKKIFWGPNYIAPRTTLAPHVAERLLKNRPKGATITCTLDAGLQRFALDSLADQLLDLRRQNVSDGAVLVLENKTGEVLAYAAFSTDQSGARHVDGIRAKRQAGSTLKPFLYGLAFDRRILTAASVLNDAPLDVAVAGGLYQPRNYDSAYLGPVSVRTALASSLNVPAVLTLNLLGPEAFLSKLRQMGIKEISESGDYYGPSLALGSADVSLWELTNGYRALANGGQWSDAILTPDMAKMVNNKRILSREAAFIVSDILADREARSSTFGLENSLATKFWSAVKTGTSKDMRDNWCLGYSSEYTVGVWVGNYSGEVHVERERHERRSPCLVRDDVLSPSLQIQQDDGNYKKFDKSGSCRFGKRWKAAAGGVVHQGGPNRPPKFNWSDSIMKKSFIPLRAP